LPSDALHAPFDFGSGFRLHYLQLPCMGIWSRWGVSCSIGRCTNVSPRNECCGALAMGATVRIERHPADWAIAR
jgi:hypothetical protein